MLQRAQLIFLIILACIGGNFAASFNNVQYTTKDYVASENDAEEMKPFIKIGQHFYYIDNTKVNWHEAAHRCRAKNADLASIESSSEMQDLSNYLLAKDYKDAWFWLSANDIAREGRFQWLSTGQDMTFSAWSQNQPDNWQGNENCVHLWIADGAYKMNDRDCAAEAFYICKVVNKSKQLTIKIW